jgi:hypothetical protein
MFCADAGTGVTKPWLTNTYIPIHHASTNREERRHDRQQHQDGDDSQDDR